MNVSTPNADQIKQIRQIARTIARKYSTRISVRKGKGTMSRYALIQGWDNKSVNARIELGRAMMAAGFVGVCGQSIPEYIDLAERYSHASFDLCLMAKA